MGGSEGEDVGRTVDRVLSEQEFREWADDEKSRAFLRRETLGDAESLLRRTTRTVSKGATRGPTRANVHRELEAAAAAVVSAESQARRRGRGARATLVAALVLGILVAAGGLLADRTPFGVSTVGAVALVAGTALLVALLGIVALRRLDRVLERESAEIRSRAGLDRLQDLAHSIARSAEQELEEAIRERLREALAPGKRYESTLRRLHAPGLAELRVHRFLVGTRGTGTLRNLMQRMPGGSIGISGPRGAGKTTLLERACDMRLTTDDQANPLVLQGPGGLDPLGVKASTPVKFESRDFLLHLSSLVCWAVLNTAPSAREEFRARMAQPDMVSMFERPITRAGIAIVILGLVVAVTPFLTSLSVDPSTVLGAVLVAIGYMTVVGSTMVNRRRRTGQRHLDSGLDGNEGDDALRRDAGRLLERIKFQQTFSSGWSGGLKFPVGVEGKMDTARSIATLQMSLPEVASELEDLLRRITARRFVIIGIDELDKMASREQAYEFLNEIKVVFGLSRCFFLISVSEDALGSFERRGMPFRDVFDSAFDEIVHVPYLTLEESSRLLAKRVIGLPEQFVALCHALGGGLPRDVIRSARDLATLTTAHTEEHDPSVLPSATADERPAAPGTHDEPSTTLADAAARLVREEIDGRVRGALIALREVKLEPELSRVVAWVRAMSAEGADAHKLLARCEAFAGSLGCHLVSSSLREDGTEAQRSLLLAIAVEALTYGYYAATVLEYFDGKLDESRFRSFDSDPANSPSQVLAGARQSFSISPRIAWDRVSAARLHAELRDWPFPELGHAGLATGGAPRGPAAAGR